MKILFLGGNGNISWHCVTKAIEAGHEVTVLNRGETVAKRRSKPEGAKQIFADIRNTSTIKEALKDLKFDVVADFICYNPQQALFDIELFRNRTEQFIFISSAANYKRPGTYPITESNILYNPDWEYAANKIESEKIFLEYYRKEGFPVTIVRPGHTYDTIIPDSVGHADWTTAKRMLEGKPIIIAGDGTTLWTVTHSEDFAKAFLYLIGNKKTIGEAYHITSDEWLTWREISEIVANALGVKNTNYIYIPSEIIAKLNPSLGNGMLGHKTWCDIYDNSKIKSIARNWKAEIPFKEGVRRTIKWLTDDTNRRRVNIELDLFYDNLCKNFSNFYTQIEKYNETKN